MDCRTPSKEMELVGEQLPLGDKNEFVHVVPRSSCDCLFRAEIKEKYSLLKHVTDHNKNCNSDNKRTWREKMIHLTYLNRHKMQHI